MDSLQYDAVFRTGVIPNNRLKYSLSPLDRHSEKSNVAIVIICSIGFMGNSNPALSLTPCMNFSRFEPTQPKSAKIEMMQFTARIIIAQQSGFVQEILQIDGRNQTGFSPNRC